MKDSQQQNNNQTNGTTAYRFQSDTRQYGALLMVLSLCTVIMPLANIVSAFGPNGAMATDPSTIPLWGLVAGCCVFVFGVTGVLTGYMATVHDYSNRYLNIFLMIIIQTAWIGYITDMVAVGMAARQPAESNGFIPLGYEPDDADVAFVGAMGVIGIMVYGFGFVGSMAFMVWSIHSYTTHHPEERSGSYFKGRMVTYSSVLAIAGLVQFLLGIFCRARFSRNALGEHGPIAVAFFIVSYPGISMYVGLLQVFNGFWGIARAYNGAQNNTTIPFYQLSLAFQWINVLVLQDIVQIAYLPAGMLAPVAPFLACFSLGLTLMPAFLDHKMNTLPETFSEDFYGESVAMSDVEENSSFESTDKDEAADNKV